MKLIKSLLFAIVIILLASCQSTASATLAYPIPVNTLPAHPYPSPDTLNVPPVEDVAPYYGRPEEAKIIIDGKEQISGIGTTFWIESKTGAETVQYHGDAFGVVAPTHPLTVTTSFSLSLILPVHFPPSELAYVIYPVDDTDRWGNEKYPEPIFDVETWNPPDPNTYSNVKLPLLPQQSISFHNLPEHLYILLVEVRWYDLGSVDYGFLLNVSNK